MKHFVFIFLLLFTLSPLWGQDSAGNIFLGTSPTPSLGVKTNLLYDATSSINLGLELKLDSRYTLDISGNYNPFTYSGNRKLRHVLVQPELRYWLCEPFYSHFFGIHALYSSYSVGHIKLPLDLYSSLNEYRYQGNLYGVGFSYGYQWVLSPRWSLEASFGFGYIYTNYDKYECKTCGKLLDSSYKHYLGPTKAGISLIYLIK
ncbi:DUF3575 domain-containing protein [Dysgonomonas sp. HGC4]|uniref:DUF3575 domain-containing protein n=1 Tax=Dysgonomonas sp. HGC4 TaxID=1658009 RepID=UPI000680BCAC|nr:DUF3575 domain-containing protein [Dysgonomonas sp. HGC4]MBD8347786.1 DUF3575 domain-containing protein [Dysgonomonas sp. HGC4]